MKLSDVTQELVDAHKAPLKRGALTEAELQKLAETVFEVGFLKGQLNALEEIARINHE